MITDFWPDTYYFKDLIGNTKNNNMYTSLSAPVTYWKESFNSETNKYVFSIDLPGVKEKDISLDFENRALCVSGVRADTKEKFNYISNSVYTGLDNPVATFEDCVLRVTFDVMVSNKKVPINQK